jgi:hypothetical protein
MKIVIQCAASKVADAGYMVTKDCRPVLFVAKPDLVPAGEKIIFARPDDLAEDGKSWRNRVLNYNKGPGSNPLNLHTAYRLYEEDVYRNLVNRFGLRNVFILSAGWGLIGAGFLTPMYDITFSANADNYRRRKKDDRYDDFNFLPLNSYDDLIFFGTKSYHPLFLELTKDYSGERVVFYNSTTPPKLQGCKLKPFIARTRTNWHYECVSRFLADAI